MTNTELLIIKRLIKEMDNLMRSGDQIAKDAGHDSVPHRECMNFFMGVGLCLAIHFEEHTGTSAKNKKPKDILEWARNLPQPLGRSLLKVD